nr:NifB/NifX family molybdenum-iron cluster-binding protein [Lachnospiraceae bacterium]
MYIAVTYENGEIYQHFGHTSSFKLYKAEENEIAEERVIDTNGSGHGALATLLSEYDVEVLICGGIGGGAQMALAQAGIRLYGGVSGGADAAVKAFLDGKLDYNPEVKCNHHGEGHGHHGNCSGGGCGNHSCGQ